MNCIICYQTNLIYTEKKKLNDKWLNDFVHRGHGWKTCTKNKQKCGYLILQSERC